MFSPDYAKPGVEKSSTKRCKFCRLCHTGPCSRVKKVEFDKEGGIISIEFFPDDIIERKQPIYLEY